MNTDFITSFSIFYLFLGRARSTSPAELNLQAKMVGRICNMLSLSSDNQEVSSLIGACFIEMSALHFLQESILLSTKSRFLQTPICRYKVTSWQKLDTAHVIVDSDTGTNVGSQRAWLGKQVDFLISEGHRYAVSVDNVTTHINRLISNVRKCISQTTLQDPIGDMQVMNHRCLISASRPFKLESMCENLNRILDRAVGIVFRVLDDPFLVEKNTNLIEVLRFLITMHYRNIRIFLSLRQQCKYYIVHCDRLINTASVHLSENGADCNAEISGLLNRLMQDDMVKLPVVNSLQAVHQLQQDNAAIANALESIGSILPVVRMISSYTTVV